MKRFRRAHPFTAPTLDTMNTMHELLAGAVCRRLALPAALLLCLAALAACGQKGALYIPEPVPAPASSQNESN